MPKAHIAAKMHDVLFYKNNFRLFIYFAFVVMFINLCLIGYMAHTALTLPEMPYFATTSDGRLIEVYPAP